MLFSSIPRNRYTEAQWQALGEQLSLLLNQHYRYTRPIYDELEAEGLFLGNGAFAVAVVEENGPVLLPERQAVLVPALERACRELLHAPLYYALMSNGTLHLILCYPRARQGEAEKETAAQIYGDLTQVADALVPEFPALEVLISDLFFGEWELFLAANSLHHAMEYYTFRTRRVRVVQLDAEQQLHGVLVEDLHIYRRFANQVAEHLTEEGYDLTALANEIVDTILQNSSASMESIHYHIQTFALTVTDHLSAAGLVDAAYIRDHSIVRRCMGFETEVELRTSIEGVIRELHRQYRTLSAVGRRQQLQQVWEYVTTHISDCNLSVNQLAEQFSISPSQLTRQFRRYYAVSLHQFIQATRLQTARQLIQAHPDWPMKRVSEAAGYVDVSTMYRAFKKVDGTSPGALKYQALHREMQREE